MIKFLVSFLTIFLLQGGLMGAKIKHLKYNDTTIPVIFEKYTQLPIFNLQLIFTNSGYIQDGNISGLANITANLLNEGSKTDGSVAFARKLENNAISIETSNGLETFVIEVSCLKSQKDLALQYLNELLSQPNLTQSSLDKLKTLTISKLSQKENDFDYIAKKNLKKIFFANTPLANSSLGTISSIQNISLEDIKNNIEKIFNINKLIIVAGGDISYKECKQDIMPLLNNFHTKKVTKLTKINIKSKPQNIIEKKDTQQAYIYFASPFDISYNAKDRYKAKVASFILGGSGFGSRLMEEIRVKQGLAYSAYGYISIAKSHSYFTGYLQTKLDNQKKAQKLVTKIVKDFVKNGVTKDELKSAKQFLLGSEPLRTETFSQRQNRAFNLYYQGLKPDYAKNELKLIQNLTLDDLNKFIKSHHEIVNLSFSIVTK